MPPNFSSVLTWVCDTFYFSKKENQMPNWTTNKRFNKMFLDSLTGMPWCLSEPTAQIGLLFHFRETVSGNAKRHFADFTAGTMLS